MNRSPTDAILERNDATFIAGVRDAVINELEVEKQSANAYAIWKEKEEVRLLWVLYIVQNIMHCLSARTLAGGR